MINHDVPFYRNLLVDELRARKERNPRYSLRALARQLAIDAPLLCKIMKGKKYPSLRTSILLTEGLKLDESRREDFLRSVFQQKVERESRRLYQSVQAA